MSSTLFTEDRRVSDVGELVDEPSGCGDSDGVHSFQEVVPEDLCAGLAPDAARLRATVNQLVSNPVNEETQTLLSKGDVGVKREFENTTDSKVDWHWQSVFGLSTMRVSILVALLFRAFLLFFSVWQDQTRWPDGQLRFTDVDYDVFTDSARALVSGQDIYEARPTFRYSPLMAALVTPGHWLFQLFVGMSTSKLEINGSSSVQKDIFKAGLLPHLWGKIVFIVADVVCACLQYHIILAEHKIHALCWSSGSRTISNLRQMATAIVTVSWLFNPVTAIVSVRGNAEAVLGACVLGCLLLLLKRFDFLAGLLFGLCVHLKLYPIIYAPAIYLWLSDRSSQDNKTFRTRIRQLVPSWSHVKFGLATMSSFCILTGTCYMWFGGMRFLHRAYFYHFSRLDLKHNFAPHFYPLYLLSGFHWKVRELSAVTPSMLTSASHDYGVTLGLVDRLRATLGQFTYNAPYVQTGLSGWIYQQAIANVDSLRRIFNFATLLPPLVLIPGLSLKLYHHLGFCWFAVTYAFVTFNKVCTSQYFLWFLVLLPVALPRLKFPPAASLYTVVAECLLLWFGSQAIWLASAYTLEMQTPSSPDMARYIWLLVWLASVIFVVINVILLRRLIKLYEPCNCYKLLDNSVERITNDDKKKL